MKTVTRIWTRSALGVAFASVLACTGDAARVPAAADVSSTGEVRGIASDSIAPVRASAPQGETGTASASSSPPAQPTPGGGPPAAGERGETPAPAFRGDFEEEILLTGELKAVRARTVVAPETSIFQMRIQYLPDEGSEVREGDPLVDFDNTALADRVQDLETRILDAETQIAAKMSELATSLMDLEIERAQKTYESDRAVVRAAIDPDVLSRKEYAERQFEKRKASMERTEVQERIDHTNGKGQAELDVLIIDKEKLERDLLSTRKDLEVLSVKAPQDGLVVYEYREGSQLKWKEGDNVWPGQPVVNLPDLSAMEVQFAVSEVDAPRLRVGMPVRITIDSLPQRELSGRVVEIPSMAVTRDPDSTVRIFRVRSTLSETIRGVMKPGMSVLGRLTVGRRSGALLVAREAVTFDGASYRMNAGPDRGAAPEWLAIQPVGRNARHYLLEPGADALEAPGAPSAEPERKPNESLSPTGSRPAVAATRKTTARAAPPPSPPPAQGTGR